MKGLGFGTRNADNFHYHRAHPMKKMHELCRIWRGSLSDLENVHTTLGFLLTGVDPVYCVARTLHSKKKINHDVFLLFLLPPFVLTLLSTRMPGGARCGFAFASRIVRVQVAVPFVFTSAHQPFSLAHNH